MAKLLPPDEFANSVFKQKNVKKLSEKFYQLEGERVRADKVFDTVLNDLSFIRAENPEVVFLEDKERRSYVAKFQKAFEGFNREKNIAKLKMSRSPSGLENSIDFQRLWPAHDVSIDMYFMVVMPEGIITDAIQFKAWDRTLAYKAPELRKEKLHQMILAKLVYNPYNLSRRSVVPVEHGLGDIQQFNLYVAPEWRLKSPQAPEELPDLARRFFEHLFPNPDCRAFVFNWLHNAILNRSETYLVLNGAKGIGKSIFAEQIVGALVGMENYAKAPTGFLESNFNSVLREKRCIYIDEHIVNTAEAHSKLKDFINKFQNIEEKYKPANASQETYNSYIISNNELTDMHATCDDRRFSIVDMTTTNLRDAFTDEEIDELISLLKNDLDFVGQVGQWIIEYGGTNRWSTFDAWKGPKFWEIVRESLSEWKKYLLDLFENGPLGEVYGYQELERGFKRTHSHSRSLFPRRQKLTDFFNSFFINEARQMIGEPFFDDAGEWQVRSLIGAATESENMFEEDTLL